MQLISTVTVGSGGLTVVSWTNLPQSYTDLVIMWSARSTPHTGIEDWTNCNFNNTTGVPLIRQLYGNGSTTTSSNFVSFELGRMNANGATASTFANVMTYIPNYSGNGLKTWSYDYVSENNASTAYQFIAAGSSGITDPITSIAISPANGPSFAQYSTFSLYGINKGSGGATVTTA